MENLIEAAKYNSGQRYRDAFLSEFEEGSTRLVYFTSTGTNYYAFIETPHFVFYDGEYSAAQYDSTWSMLYGYQTIVANGIRLSCTLAEYVNDVMQRSSPAYRKFVNETGYPICVYPFFRQNVSGVWKKVWSTSRARLGTGQKFVDYNDPFNQAGLLYYDNGGLDYPTPIDNGLFRRLLGKTGRVLYSNIQTWSQPVVADPEVLPTTRESGFKRMVGYHMEFWNNLSLLMPDFYQVNDTWTYWMYQNQPDFQNRYVLISKTSPSTPVGNITLQMLSSMTLGVIGQVYRSFKELDVTLWPLKLSAAFGTGSVYEYPVSAVEELGYIREWAGFNDAESTMGMLPTWRDLVQDLYVRYGTDFYSFNNAGNEQLNTGTGGRAPVVGPGPVGVDVYEGFQYLHPTLGWLQAFAPVDASPGIWYWEKIDETEVDVDGMV